MHKKCKTLRWDGKRVYPTGYIGGKVVFLAVMVARKMIREGMPAPVAIHRAANYHRVSVTGVAHYVG